MIEETKWLRPSSLWSLSHLLYYNMNDRIHTYLTELYKETSEDYKKIDQLIDAVEKKLNVTIQDMLIFEEDNYLYAEPPIPLYRAVALFTEKYFVVTSIQPEIYRSTTVRSYYHDGACFDEETRRLAIIGSFDFANVYGQTHWAMDIIMKYVIPRIERFAD